MTHFYSSKELEIFRSASNDAIRHVLTEMGWALDRQELPSWLKGKSVELWSKPNSDPIESEPYHCLMVEPVHPDWFYRRLELVQYVLRAEDISSFEFSQLLKKHGDVNNA